MKLFYQLSEDDQHKALHHCASMVIDDILGSGINVDFSDDDAEMKKVLEQTLFDALKFVDREDQINHLLGVESVYKLVFDLALDLAKSAFYHSDEEVVIYPSMLGELPGDMKSEFPELDSSFDDDISDEEFNEFNLKAKKNDFSIN